MKATADILIFRPGQLGDTLVALPAFHAIRRNYSDCRLTLLHDRQVGRSFVEPPALLAGTNLFADFIGYAFDRRCGSRFVRLVDRVKLIGELRRRKFDLLFNMAPGWRSWRQLTRDICFFRLAGIERQIMLSKYRPPQRPSHPLPRLPREADFLLDALSRAGLVVPEIGEGCMDLNLGADEDHEIAAWLRNEHVELPSDMCLIGVGPGSKMTAKLWNWRNYAEVMRRLAAQGRIYPVLLGGIDDREIADGILTACGNGINACGKLSVRASARLLEKCRMFVGNDTGTLHLAAAVGVPCVAIFSARDYPGKWYPYGDAHRIHRAAVICEGCKLQECRYPDDKCVDRITVDDVYQSCRELLGRKKTSPGADS